MKYMRKIFSCGGEAHESYALKLYSFTEFYQK